MTKFRVVSVKMEEELVELIDKAVDELRGMGKQVNRSDFIRTAVLSHLDSLKPIFSPELQFRINMYLSPRVGDLHG